MDLYRTKILGTGKYHPERIMSNDEISENLDTDDEWIVKRTGIKERRVGDLEKHDYPSGMAMRSAGEAIKNAGLDVNDIDLILFSVTLPDMFFPNTASHLQKALGITSKCACLDINAACTGWVYGFTMANSLIQTGTFKNILLVGTEMTSTFNNWEDRNSCILFGDGSGAVVLGRAAEDEKCCYFDSVLECDSTKIDSLIIYNGGSKSPITHDILDNRQQFVEMDGQIVFKNAVKTMAAHCRTLLKKHDLTADDIDWFIPHQANLRIIETTAKLLNYPMEKVIVNVEKYANTSSASIPVALHEAVMDGRIKRGQRILIAAFGAGLTSAAAIIEY